MALEPSETEHEHSIASPSPRGDGQRRGDSAQQSGWSDVRARATPVAASELAPMAASETTEFACADVPLVTPADAQRTLQAIERGSETDRFEGLLRSGDAGVVVPEDTLKKIVDTDASERVRLLAFERLIEARSGEPQALRAALEAGLYVPTVHGP